MVKELEDSSHSEADETESALAPTPASRAAGQTSSARGRMVLAHVDMPSLPSKGRPTAQQSQTRQNAGRKPGNLPPPSPLSSDQPPESEEEVYEVDEGPRRPSRKKATKKQDKPSAAVDYRNSDEESPESNEEQDASDDSDYDNPDSPVRKPRVTRSARAAKKAPSTDASSADEGIRPGKARTGERASNRERNQVSYRELALEDSDIEMLDEAPAAKPKKAAGTARVTKKVASRPAYGNIRHTRELSVEDNDDPLHTHRNLCDKCSTAPSHEQLAQHRYKKRKKNKRNGKRNAEPPTDDSSLSEEEAEFDALGGWVRCLKCCTVSHWKCLNIAARDEILRAVREKEPTEDEDGKPLPRRKKLEVFETTEFACSYCSKGAVCFSCKEVAIEKFDPQSVPTEQTTDVESPLLFRCKACKRAAHYNHLPAEDAEDAAEIATEYQQQRDWTCADCSSYKYNLENILAWRPFPANAVEPPLVGDIPDYRNMLPREYLVKWEGRAFTRVQWVPHMWLLAKYQSKLKNFLTRGSLIKLLDEHASAQPSKASTPALEDDARVTPSPSDNDGEGELGPPEACDDAMKRIPNAWRAIDRVLDVWIWCPPGCKPHDKNQAQPRNSSSRRVIEDEEDEEDELNEEANTMDLDYVSAMGTARAEGAAPKDRFIKDPATWEKKHGRSLTVDDIGLVVWGYFKWGDLTYDQSTWDTPPDASDPSFPSFRRAFERYLDSRNVFVKSKRAIVGRVGRFKEMEGQPRIASDPKLELRDFQIDGINWLMYSWWRGQSGAILADEMGLGKTVQMTTLIGLMVKKHEASPILVVVPNSTLTNWVREFERWAPHVRVVPFYGDANSRKIIKSYELHHENAPKGCTTHKFHVLLATYEAFTNVKDAFAVFKSVPYYEAIVVDEAQRLKSDSSLLFKRLNELKVHYRVLMTGTPLNNNIRELFNLMNFLDPQNWDDLPGLEAKFETLDESLLSELHEMLKPYFLRRTKAMVLSLPPKNELIVPVTMSPLQKTVYKTVIGQNAELLQALLRGKSGAKTQKSKLNNILMQLRKCIQHPYLVSPELEDRQLPRAEMHRNLVDGSAKLQLLKMMLPQLKSRGHRVLLFSQFRIALDIIEDFLKEEGYKFRRLDGETKQTDRQKCMDDFNAPESDVFIFILSTRAGGVGINLFTADTVIIFDPDYNPHQDLQAIARSHRFGQTKTVLVFKLMMKDSAEEKIMVAGKKKLALDHLIVQSMDDDNGATEDVQTMLSHGAKALFDDEATQQSITYSSQDVLQLIEKNETAVAEESKDGEGALSFEFAKVWLPGQGGALEDVEDAAQPTEEEDGDFWAKHLAQAAAEQEAKEREKEAQMGRGARRRREVNYAINTPADKKKKRHLSATDGDSDDMDVDFTLGDGGDSDSDSSFEGAPADRHGGDRMEVDLPEATAAASGHLPNRSATTDVNAPPRKKANTQAELAQHAEYCGLCHSIHGDKSCYLTSNINNLLEYRAIILSTTHDEPYEMRNRAIQAIDRYLNQNGHSEKVRGLPSMPLRPAEVALSTRKRHINAAAAAVAAAAAESGLTPASHHAPDSSLTPGQSGAPSTPSAAASGPAQPSLSAPVGALQPEPLRRLSVPAPTTQASAVPPQGSASTPPKSVAQPLPTVPMSGLVQACVPQPSVAKRAPRSSSAREPDESSSTEPPAQPPVSTKGPSKVASSSTVASSVNPFASGAGDTQKGSASTPGPKASAAASGSQKSTPGSMRQTTLAFGRRDSSGSTAKAADSVASGSSPTCIVCDGSPTHPIQQCPVIVQGSATALNTAYNRLKRDPANFTPEIKTAISGAFRAKGMPDPHKASASPKPAAPSTAQSSSPPPKPPKKTRRKSFVPPPDDVIEITDSD